MYIIWVMHLFQFLMNNRIYVMQSTAVADDDYRRADDEQEEDDDIQWEYRPMKRVFYFKMWWVWIVQAIAYIVVITLYFKQNGSEIVFAMYIPVDILLFLGMAAYYF